MTELALRDQITKLVALQTIDSEIYKLRDELAARPNELKEKELAFEEKKKILAALDEKSKDLQKQKKDKELELGSKEEEVRRLQGQLSSLKTNKEYTAMLQQIAGVKADASLLEDKILGVLDQMDALKVEVTQAKEVLVEEEKKFNIDKKSIEDRMKEIEQRLAQLDAQRKQAIVDIDKKILSQYERVLKSRDGLAITLVRNNACLGCNMNVPAQVINQIKMYDKPVTCEICQRILYLEDE